MAILPATLKPVSHPNNLQLSLERIFVPHETESEEQDVADTTLVGHLKFNGCNVSYFNCKLLINKDFWAVTMVRDNKSFGACGIRLPTPHVKLIIEGILDNGKRVTRMGHLMSLQKNFCNLTSFGIVVAEDKHIIRKFKSKTKTWIRSRVLVEAMWSQIMKECIETGGDTRSNAEEREGLLAKGQLTGNPVPFCLTGSDSLLATEITIFKIEDPVLRKMQEENSRAFNFYYDMCQANLKLQASLFLPSLQRWALSLPEIDPIVESCLVITAVVTSIFTNIQTRLRLTNKIRPIGAVLGFVPLTTSNSVERMKEVYSLTFFAILKAVQDREFLRKIILASCVKVPVIQIHSELDPIDVAPLTYPKASFEKALERPMLSGKNLQHIIIKFDEVEKEEPIAEILVPSRISFTAKDFFTMAKTFLYRQLFGPDEKLDLIQRNLHKVDRKTLKRHNCFTWSKEKLAMINVSLGRTRFDKLVCVPLPHLQGDFSTGVKKPLFN